MASSTIVEDTRRALYESGKASTDLVLPGSSWVHRRVESIRYVELDLLKVRLSIDFTIPVDCAADYVPLTILPKLPPVLRLDYRDEDGHPLPLLTSSENGAADYGLMEGLSLRYNPSLMQDPTYATALAVLSRGPETHLRHRFLELRDIVARTSGNDDVATRLVDFAAALTDSTLLWLPVARTDPGRRTIVKLSYMVPSSSTDRLVLLAVVPALIGYLVTQSSSEPLVRRYLLGVQALVVAAATVPAAMAVTLLAYAGKSHCLAVACAVSMAAAWGIAACLLVSALRSGSRQKL